MGNDKSCQPCGCDEGANWVCERHQRGGFNHPGLLQASARYPAPPSTATTISDAEWRKQRPLYSGVLMYFPDALLEVAHTSWKGNEQHNPGQPLHWDRSKSTDEADACARHLLEAGTHDTDGVRHSAKVAWRALALLQKEIEGERAAQNTLRPGLVVELATRK